MRKLPALGCAGAALTVLLLTHAADAQYGQQPPPPGGYQQQPPPPGGYQQQPPPPGGGYQQQPPPGGGYQQQPPPGGGYGQQQGGYGQQQGYGYGQPPPPPQKRSKGFEMPAFSIRLDPFNWLLEGRLGVELEVEVWEFITVETVPVFVANTRPPSMNFVGRDDELTQHSNGWGPMSGASIGAGFWLMGKPFKGYVLRAMFTNYGYEYRTEDDLGIVDQVKHTERRLVFMFGSQSNFGPFSIAGGIGLGYELNQQERCFPDPMNQDRSAAAQALTENCDGEYYIALERPSSPNPALVNLNGWAHPIYISARISLGFTFGL